MHQIWQAYRGKMVKNNITSICVVQNDYLKGEGISLKKKGI